MKSLFLSCFTLALCLSGCKAYDASLIGDGSAGVPEKPEEATSSEMDDGEAVFALYNLSLDHSGERWRRLGLDLDGVNTGSIEDAAECVAANGRPPLDGDQGIDNAFGQHVLPTLVNLISCMEDEIALNQATGHGTILVRLRRWNGTPDDAQVDVSVFSSVDGTSRDTVDDLQWAGSNGANLMEPGTIIGAAEPDWDGADTFFVDPGTVVDNDLGQPRISRSDAYISKGRLVLPLDGDSSFVLLTKPGSLALSINGFLIADLSEDGQTLTKGLIAGRASSAQLVSGLTSLGVCDESFQESIVSLLTDNLDLRLDPAAGSSQDACTATGVSFAFQGMRARLASALAPVPLPIPDPCAVAPTSGVQPAFGRCCATVERNAPDTIDPAECSQDDLAVFENLPVPVPVPAPDDF